VEHIATSTTKDAKAKEKSTKKKAKTSKKATKENVTSTDTKPQEAPAEIETPMTEEERTEFERLANEITENITASFVVPGKNLTEINEHRFYREEADTFDEWVKTRYDMTRRHAYRWMEAFRVATVLFADEVPSGVTEYLLRPLTAKGFDNETVEALWTVAKGDRETLPKASDVKRVVDEKLNKTTSVKRVSEKPTEKDPIPKEAAGVFQQAAERLKEAKTHYPEDKSLVEAIEFLERLGKLLGFGSQDEK